MLLQLGTCAHYFVTWLDADEPLVRAYTACILANIAFLTEGQENVLAAGGVTPLVALLKTKDEKKVTLHATAAIQNLTYKNTQCCLSVLEQGGEKARALLPELWAESPSSKIVAVWVCHYLSSNCHECPNRRPAKKLRPRTLVSWQLGKSGTKLGALLARFELSSEGGSRGIAPVEVHVRRYAQRSFGIRIFVFCRRGKSDGC